MRSFLENPLNLLFKLTTSFFAILLNTFLLAGTFILLGAFTIGCFCLYSAGYSDKSLYTLAAGLM